MKIINDTKKDTVGEIPSGTVVSHHDTIYVITNLWWDYDKNTIKNEKNWCHTKRIMINLSNGLPFGLFHDDRVILLDAELIVK